MYDDDCKRSYRAIISPCGVFHESAIHHYVVALHTMLSVIVLVERVPSHASAAEWRLHRDVHVPPWVFLNRHGYEDGGTTILITNCGMVYAVL